jgi:membrane-associated phospholipid phosphatase
MTILYELGAYGPIFLILLSWYLLWDYKNLFFYFNVGIIANAVLNIMLKGLIQEPRPIFDSEKVSLVKRHAKEYFFQNGIPFDIFGMPSGHAQMALFMSTFIYLSLERTNLLYLYLVFSLIICYQRVNSKYHSIPQVIVGSIVGSGFAYIVYQLAREKIKGRIRERPDDNGPV